MSLNKNTVKYLADLSRIAVSEDEEASLLQDLNKIVAYIEQLNEVDTTHVEPCTYVTSMLSQTPLRDDVVVPTLSREQFLKGTPKQISGMVWVPPVLKQE